MQLLKLCYPNIPPPSYLILPYDKRTLRCTAGAASKLFRLWSVVPSTMTCGTGRFLQKRHYRVASHGTQDARACRRDNVDEVFVEQLPGAAEP